MTQSIKHQSFIGCRTDCRDDIGEGRATASRLAAPHELTVGWMSVVRLGEDAVALPPAICPTPSFIGLGSNEGDRLGFLRQAREEIGAIPGCRVIASAPVYETEPVGVPEAYRDAWFLNTVLLCETTLVAVAWLEAIHGIEQKLCRRRTGERNAPRTIDIDILTYGDVVMDTPKLILPHPQCALRRFVCQPLVDIAPDFILPGHTSTVTEILKKLPMTPIVTKVAQSF